jgi:hypothetical protein
MAGSLGGGAGIRPPLTSMANHVGNSAARFRGREFAIAVNAHRSWNEGGVPAPIFFALGVWLFTKLSTQFVPDLMNPVLVGKPTADALVFRQHEKITK